MSGGIFLFVILMTYSFRVVLQFLLEATFVVAHVLQFPVCFFFK